jgi:hypothetical protein
MDEDMMWVSAVNLYIAEVRVLFQVMEQWKCNVERDCPKIRDLKSC